MKLILGLGNPGEKYERTRHNVGFMILDTMAEKTDATFRNDQKFVAEIAETEKNKLVKPQTFMNESGRAVRLMKDFYKIGGDDVWVIHDDVDLEFGRVRVGLGGSSAGHKGVQSIIDAIGEDFWRIRVGVGKSDQYSTEDWVLMNFSEADQEKLNSIVDKTAKIVVEFLGSEIKEQTINIVGE